MRCAAKTARGFRYFFRRRKQTECLPIGDYSFVYLFEKRESFGLFRRLVGRLSQLFMPDAGNLESEFEKALSELRRLCDEDVPLDERKHRLAVRKEMNRLHRLYVIQLESDDSADDGGESETLAEVRQHLEPLGLAPEGTPLPELARLAALKITEK